MDRETKVGLTVIALLSILIFGYLWLTNFKIRQRRHYYFIKFKEVGWVKKGDPVTILGVPNGKVEDVKLYPDSVIVKISVNGMKLTEGSIAYIESQGIIGQMRISLKLGKGKPLKEKSVIPGIKRKDLADIIAFLGDASDSIMDIIHNLNVATKKMDTALSAMRIDVSNFLKRTDAHFDTLVALLSAEKVNLDSTHTMFNKLLADYDTVAILLKLSKGSLIKFIQEDSLYRHMDSTAKAINSLIEDIKKNPDKYLKISIF